MKTVITFTKEKYFIHKEGSRYECYEWCDDGIHMIYTEIDKEGFGISHKIKNTERAEWDKLVNKYPL